MLKSRTKVEGDYLSPSNELEDGFYWYSRPFLKWQETVEIHTDNGKKYVMFKRYVCLADDYIHISNTPMDAISNDSEFIKCED